MAFATKNFSQCDALQDTIRDIQAARSKLPLPEVIPESRRELDLLLLEARYTLDHTVTVHDLVLCAKLELRIQQLEARKSTFCTIEERRSSLKAAVTALDDAMERKEFKRCAQLQQVAEIILNMYCHFPLHLTAYRITPVLPPKSHQYNTQLLLFISPLTVYPSNTISHTIALALTLH